MPLGLPRPAALTLAALTGVNLFNYIDRFVIASLFTSLGKPVEDGGLALTKDQQGLLYSAFIIVYCVASPVFGVLGDRGRRMWLLAGAVALWSVATAAGGWTSGFVSLFVARAITGIGEAAYASIAPAVISDLVPAEGRSRALSVYNAAIPVGAALGFALGGFVAASHGWRAAFLVAGVPGIALALVVLFLRDPPRGQMDPAAQARKPWGEAVRELAHGAFLWPVAGYVLQTAGYGALGVWAPSYLEQSKGIPGERAAITVGAIVAGTGLVGTLAGGWIGDRWRRRDRRGLMFTCAVSSLLATPFLVLLVLAKSEWAVWTTVAISSFLLALSIGPVNSQIVNALPAATRATGVAASTTLIHLLGDVPSVPLIGWLERSLGGGSAFDWAMGVVPATIFASAIVWWWAGRREPATAQ
jgi:predicted MFS family arabinose efflux permease